MEMNVADALRAGGELFARAMYEDAERVFRAIADVEASNFYALQGVGMCLAEMNRPGDALPWYDRAFGYVRADLMALTANRARALADSGNVSEALHLLGGLLQQEPKNPLFLYNHGLVLLQMGEHRRAIAAMDAVLELDPGNDKARFGRGFASLVMGDYASGFRDYECRSKDPMEHIDAPEWTGDQDIAGKVVLVHSDMGLGDNIMFMRYVPMIAARGGVPVVVVSDNVRPLVPDGVQVVGLDRATWPKIDYWVRFMSLAWCFRTTRESVPAPVTLHYDDALLAKWRGIIGGDQLKVGLCWAGSPSSRYDAQRTVPLAELSPLFSIPNVKFFSLQKEVRDSDLAEFYRAPVVNLASKLETFADTACAMKCLDLVITVDTSVAHMAGTVGVPTWVMLTSYRTYWLWIENITTSPWYPSIRVQRQVRDGDWPSVVLPLAEKLRQLAERRAA